MSIRSNDSAAAPVGGGMYQVIDTASGSAVVRADGHYAEFLGAAGQMARQEADDAARLLRDGQTTEDDYEWTDYAWCERS